MIDLPLDFFKSSIANGISKMPSEKIRDLQQAAFSAGFDVTSAKYCVQEQSTFGSEEYHDIDVWIDGVVGMTSRGTSNGDDFRQLLFEDINHEVRKGLYYKFDDNVWITYFTDDKANLSRDIGVRRCNNAMRIIDPQNGSVFCIPCVVDYDMTAPSMQVASSVLTPNSHAIVLVQGNKDTNRLFKINTRYILGGRPFKLLAYQNTIINKELADYPTLLTLDLFLDELHAKDDIQEQLADNGEYQYVVSIDSGEMELTEGSVGSFTTSVTLNGVEVNRQICWETFSPSVVAIDESGNYKVVGDVGQSATIMASLEGNENVYDTITLKIVNAEDIKAQVIIDPSFKKIRQYETIDFNVQTAFGSDVLNPDESIVECESDCASIVKNGNRYSLTADKLCNEPIELKVSVRNAEPKIETANSFHIEVTSMMG